MRNHQAVIDTANGTTNFSHVAMTLTMTAEIANPEPLQLLAEGNQTLYPQQTTTVATMLQEQYIRYHKLTKRQT